MSRSFLGETSKTAVSHCAVTNKRRDVLTKQVNAGQQTVVATEPSRRDGGNRDLIKVEPSGDLGSHVRLDMSSVPSAKSLSPDLVLRRWWWCSWLRILWPELCNLAQRIRWAREIQLWELRGFQGQHPLELKAKANSQCRICRPVYMTYMQQLSSLRPSLTVVDSCLVSQAWWAGWQSAHRMGRMQNQQGKCSSCSPVDSDSMLPLAVQQSTKRDPSNSLPSRE